MEIYLLIGTHIFAFVLGVLGNIFIFHYKKMMKKKKKINYQKNGRIKNMTVSKI